MALRDPMIANVAEDESWRDCRGEGLQCTALTRRVRCPRTASLALRRGKQRRWWAYCDEHAFGRVILDDGIYHVFEAFPPAEIQAVLDRV